MEKNTMDVIKSIQKNINRYYVISVADCTEIYENSPDPVDVIYNAFCFGYAQGSKAEKAAQRKRAAADREVKA